MTRAAEEPGAHGRNEPPLRRHVRAGASRVALSKLPLDAGAEQVCASEADTTKEATALERRWRLNHPSGDADADAERVS